MATENPNPLDNIFNPMETQMGSEMFQAQLELSQSYRALNETKANLMEADERLKNAKTLVVLGAVFAGFVFIIPATVILYGMAFS